MFTKLSDGYHALGIGVVFVGYAAYLFIERWQEQRKTRDETRAQLILNDAGRRREAMLESEGIADDGN